MRAVILIITFIGSYFTIYSQQKAITETGDEVILYDDGTWSYLGEQEEELEIPTNDKTFTKNKSATFLLKSKNIPMGFWLNPKEWSFQKGVDNPEAEYELRLKKGDLYGMVISEKIEIPLLNLKNIALENGRSAAPDFRVVKEEYRMVNGLKVLMLQMNGTSQGIKFSFFGYYYSDENGTVQFVTYTATNLLEQLKPEIEQLLNGIVSLKE